MAFKATGFKTLTHIGTVDGSVGSNRSQHGYVTTDDAAAVETSGYFDDIRSRLKTGDQIIASLDIEGDVDGCVYVVSAVTPVVTVKPFLATGIA